MSNKISIFIVSIGCEDEYSDSLDKYTIEYKSQVSEEEPFLPLLHQRHTSGTSAAPIWLL